jgi:hypothetical protein
LTAPAIASAGGNDARAKTIACYVTAIAQAPELKPNEKETLTNALRGCLEGSSKFSRQDFDLAAQVLVDTVKDGPLVAIVKGVAAPRNTVPEILDGMGRNADLRDAYLPARCHGSAGRSTCPAP